MPEKIVAVNSHKIIKNVNE